MSENTKKVEDSKVPAPNSRESDATDLNDTLELILGVLKRGRWWIVSVGCLISLGVVAVATKLPDHFISRATLIVVQQQVSPRYVESDNTTSPAAAVQAMELEALSRGGLLGIIHDLGLYADLNNRSPEQLVDRMRRDIDVQPFDSSPGQGDFSAFTISFTAPTPRLAQEVTGRLTSLFIKQKLRSQGEKAAHTTKFLSDELDTAKLRLTQQEERLQAFKSKTLGELPEDQAANLSALAAMRGDLETVATSLAQARQQQASLQSPLDERLSRLESERVELLTRYTSKHPEVIKKDREIATIKGARGRLSGTSSGQTIDDNDTIDDPALAGIVRQADMLARTIQGLAEQQEKLRVESEQYQKRLNLTPTREHQLAVILRDYDLFKQDYENLQKAKLQADMSNTLEENREGQQFRLLDPPSLPLSPSSPNRLKICLIGMAGGIVLGVALAFLMDVRKGCFYCVRTLRHSLPLPLILGVPLVFTPTERRMRGLRLAFEWLAASAMILAMLTAEIYVYRNG